MLLNKLKYYFLPFKILSVTFSKKTNQTIKSPPRNADLYEKQQERSQAHICPDWQVDLAFYGHIPNLCHRNSNKNPQWRQSPTIYFRVYIEGCGLDNLFRKPAHSWEIQQEPQPSRLSQSHMITVHSQETRHTPSSSVRVSHCPLGWGSVSTLHCFRVNKSKFLKFLWFVKYLQWDKKWWKTSLHPQS